MSDRGNDLGGHWPVGIWFAMVGVSAGTVASFSLIGWTFARGLYGGGDGAEPLDYEPQTVIIEAETPDPVGLAGGDDGPIDPSDPGPQPQIAVSPAEPRAERIAEADAPPNSPREEAAPDESPPPQLVPVYEDEDDCGREESATGEDPEGEPNQDNGNGPDQGQEQGQDGDHGRDHLDLHELDLDLGLNLDLGFEQADIELDLEIGGAPEPESEPASDPAIASAIAPED